MKSAMTYCCLIALLAAAPVSASSPAEKLVCTSASRASWMPEKKIREVFGEQNFTLTKLKVSGGNCYEFYAIERDGSVVEAYYHPVTGAVKRYHRVPAAEVARR